MILFVLSSIFSFLWPSYIVNKSFISKNRDFLINYPIRSTPADATRIPIKFLLSTCAFLQLSRETMNVKLMIESMATINVANKVENQDLLSTQHVIAGLCETWTGFLECFDKINYF